MKEKFIQHFTRALKDGDIDEIERLITFMTVNRDKYAEIAREMDDEDFDCLEEAYQFGAKKRGFFNDTERDRIIRFTKSLEKASYAY